MESSELTNNAITSGVNLGMQRIHDEDESTTRGSRTTSIDMLSDFSFIKNLVMYYKKYNTFLAPSKDLLEWKDMPHHLQFNPYIKTGYRPLTSFIGCVQSLFYMHNETVNILTHGIAMVYVLLTVPSIIPWDGDFWWLSWCHFLGSLAPWCGSFVYHLFMSLEFGQKFYCRLLQLDMCGIWVSQSFGAMTMVTATVFCWRIKWLYILAYGLLCCWGLHKALTAASRWQRRLCFLLPFIMRVCLTVFRVLKWGGGNPDSLIHVFLQDGIAVVGGVIGAMHIPEKWYPGTVDYYMNSHNIMHVLVVLAVYSMHQATIRDLDWLYRMPCGQLVNGNATVVPIQNIINHQVEL